MNIKVYKNREAHQIDNDVYGTQNENNITVLKIEVPEQYENWNKRIVFITPDGNFEDIIENNTYILTKEITKYEEVEAYIWLTEKADTTEESIGDFRSKTFPLSFYLNENPNTEAPTDKQIDIYNSLLTALNVEIEEVKQINKDFTKLKQDVEQSESSRNTSEKAREKAETERATAESTRKKNESDRIINENGRAEAENIRSNAEKTRQANESKRIANETARKLAEENREKTTKEAVNNIKDLSASYEQLAEEKKTELNNYTTNLETSLKNKLDTYEEGKEEELDIHKTTLETEMTNTFNTNASTKKTEYDNNATSKLEEYNNNSTTKLAEFNENAESYEKRIAELETERDEIAEQMPWNTTEIQESIHIEDSAKYSRNKLDLFGNLKQETREGYNLFNEETSVKGYVNGKVGGRYGEFSSDSNVSRTSDYIPIKPSKEYMIIYDYANLSAENDRGYCFYDNEKNLIVSSSTTCYSPTNKKTIITTMENASYIRFSYDINCTKIMLIEGTIEKTYEAYGAMPSIEFESMPVVATGVQKIKILGKNLISKWIENKLVNKNGILESNNVWNTSELIQVDSNQFIAFYHNYIISQQSLIITEYDKNLNLIKRNIQGATTTYTPYILKTDVDTRYVRLSYNKANNNNELMLEYNDVATGYEPYTEEIFELDLGTTELCKINDYSDYFWKDEISGEWYKHKIIDSVTLNGTEKWSKSATTIVDRMVVTQKIKTPNLKANIAYSNYCVFGINSTEVGYFWIDNYSNARRIIINFSAYNTNTIETFADWVKEHNITIKYVLETPVDERITDKKLIKQLEQLYNNFKLQKGTNNIIVESENGVTTELQLTYMQDNNLIREQEHKALEDRITELEAMILSNASEEV